MPTRTRPVPAHHNGGDHAADLPAFTVPGLEPDVGARVAELLQARLDALLDLGLTLKHIHWNVVGPHFIGVHEMLDPQYVGIQHMVDSVAERVATLGGQPNGLPGHLVESRAWDDYPLLRASVTEHLIALDEVYAGVIRGHRKAVDQLEDLDPVSHDLLVAQAGELEQYHWFVRAHLEADDGRLAQRGDRRQEVSV